MPVYLYSAKNLEGKDVTERVEANSLELARYNLEIHGYSAIVFQDGDFAQDLKKLHGDDYLKNPAFTPQLQLAVRQQGGSWVTVKSMLQQTKQLFIPLIIWVAVSLLMGPPFGPLAWTGFILLTFLTGFICYSMIPSIIYNKLLACSVHGEWEKVMFYAAQFRLISRLGMGKLKNLMEIDMREAYALAAQDRRNEALAIIDKYERDPAIPKALFYGRIASIYAMAKDYVKMSECQAKAIELGDGGAGPLIDYAMGAIERHKDIETARNALEMAAEKEQTEVASAFFSLCKGIVFLEEENYFQARFHLLEAYRKITPYTQNILITGFIAKLNAYHAIALVHLGERNQAQQLLQSAVPYLKAQREFALLKRCDDAINR